MKILLPALAILVMTFGSVASPAHAATDRTCAVYVSVINKTLMHRLRLNENHRNQIKALRQQGLETIEDGVSCRLPLAQALKMLGVAAPDLGNRSRKRRVHRLGS